MGNPTYYIQGNNIVIFIDGKTHTISKESHVLDFVKTVEAIKTKDWDTVRTLLEPSKIITDYFGGKIRIADGEMFWNGKVLHNALSDRVLKLIKEGFPAESLIKFAENLMSNTSMNSVEQLYGFLERHYLPITDDGHFLAYKKVRKDFKDIYSGSIDNSVGKIVEMPRNQVSDNPNSLCSSGLHFCSIGYLSKFGLHDDPIVILKINPADVVSIPNDSNGEKGRCCKYEVVGILDDINKVEFAKAVSTKFTKTSPAVSTTDAPAAPAKKPVVGKWPQPATKVDLYNVYRKSDNALVLAGVTKQVADERVLKNKRQKKATLVVVKTASNT